MERRSASLTLVGAMGVLALWACGGGGPDITIPPTTLAPAKAVIKVLIDPDPIIAEASGDPSLPWDFRFNLQLSDSGGVAFVVTSMQTMVISAATGNTLTTSIANPFVGVKIPALGQETRQYHMGPYRMAGGTKEARVNLKINFTDDKGNPTVFDQTVNVQFLGRFGRLGG